MLAVSELKLSRRSTFKQDFLDKWTRNMHRTTLTGVLTELQITFIPAACSHIWRIFHHIQPLLAMSAQHVLQL
jgi:hypothetical protein